MVKQNRFLYALAILSFCLVPLGHLRGDSNPTIILQAKKREIVVNGKRAQMYEIAQTNGVQALSLNKGESFHVILENKLDVPTGIHWHGLILPNNQDGVPFVTQPSIEPGRKYVYNFPLVQAGTFWMHAHYGLQEQRLLAAPLILHDPAEPQSNRQEIVMFLSDFTFQNPYDIFKQLKFNGSKADSGKTMNMTTDLNDVSYDAFLTNWRTLSDPEVVKVELAKRYCCASSMGQAAQTFLSTWDL